MRLAVEYPEVMVQVFGAGLVWSTLLHEGSFVVELQEDGVAHSIFVGCHAPRLGSGGPWRPASNPRGEWGAWSRSNGVHFACVSRRPTPGKCLRRYNPSAWESFSVEADVKMVAD